MMTRGDDKIFNKRGKGYKRRPLKHLSDNQMMSSYWQETNRRTNPYRHARGHLYSPTGNLRAGANCLYTEFDSSDYVSEADPARHEYDVQHDAKRYKLAHQDNESKGYVNSRSALSFSKDYVQTVVSESSQDDCSIDGNQNNPHLLSLPEDKSHLTELHCFVRRHCVYIFCANSNEVDAKRKGRKKSLVLGQIGIGCLHCKDSKSRLKGCTYFPSSISGIYNATMIIMQRHFPVCPSVTKEVYGEYNKLKGLTARSASTKEYWVSAATKLGMVDTKLGVFFKSKDTGLQGATIRPAQIKVFESDHLNKNSIAEHKGLRSLVEESDKLFATEYAYFVMEQMTTCVFTEADRLGKRKSHEIGFPGLACRYCYGNNGSGRFFHLSVKTFSDVSKSLHVLRNHLVKCAKAPSGMAATVQTLYDRHQEEKQTTPFGSQKIFFDLIWKRLHPEMTGERQKSAKIKAEKDSSSSVKELQDGTRNQTKSYSKEVVCFSNDFEPGYCCDSVEKTSDARSVEDVGYGIRNEPHDSETCDERFKKLQDVEASDDPYATIPPLPPLPSPPYTTAAYLAEEEEELQPIPRGRKSCKGSCRIPKKRYTYTHGTMQASSSACAKKESPILSDQNQNQAVPESYTESDLSVAMILASGFATKSLESV